MYSMKLLLVAGFTLASFGLKAETFKSPIHSSEEVMSALYTQAKLDASDVSVVLFRFDYKEQRWHIELSNKEMNCLDCYPSFSFKNEKKLELRSVPHG